VQLTDVPYNFLFAPAAEIWLAGINDALLDERAIGSAEDMVDSDDDRDRLRQRMDDLLRDARALRALIEEASQPRSSGGPRKPSDPTASSALHHPRPPRG
jgi:hypothetical protein